MTLRFNLAPRLLRQLPPSIAFFLFSRPVIRPVLQFYPLIRYPRGCLQSQSSIQEAVWWKDSPQHTSKARN